jgi:tRNA (guanine-N7-)-methyltransferase
MLLKPFVNGYQLQSPQDLESSFSSSRLLEVEIGFGLGEVLIESALKYPNKNFIGIEENGERVYKTLKRMAVIIDDRKDLSLFQNVKIFKMDAQDVFERLFASQTIDRIFSLFPCPWPKKEHIKHRLFHKKFLTLLNSRLKLDGELYLVTDYKPYYEWIQRESKETGFVLKKSVIDPRFNTKFEKKWLSEGQKKFYELKLIKKSHKDRLVKKDIALRIYRIQDFDHKNFKFANQTGNPSVIFKDFIFDVKHKRGMVYLIVVEDHLIQHFWASIRFTAKDWVISRADGQNIFCTPGIIRALELVYKSSLKTTKTQVKKSKS